MSIITGGMRQKKKKFRPGKKCITAFLTSNICNIYIFFMKVKVLIAQSCPIVCDPMDRGAWWVAVHRVAKSWTRLKQLSIVRKINRQIDNF